MTPELEAAIRRIVREEIAAAEAAKPGFLDQFKRPASYFVETEQMIRDRQACGQISAEKADRQIATLKTLLSAALPTDVLEPVQ